ncbi:putative TIM-barrel fold metal-dependent hydrolase [Paralcaligenes ureilyticus]|uniref:Putative TIM-barrel fold metal-dependent hydrolase n=2 Tax=Paralcaligenes ureilyticus TaxID=627131 RepID=A0A4R3M734_9BURK|nr:putative TIM-barrel fold metal-dependent hydrolase [Paralcaligenes ureilyticus]
MPRITPILSHSDLLMSARSLPGNMPPGAIDAHAHVFDRDLPMIAQRRYTPDYPAPLGRYLSLLHDHGLAGGVLVQPSFLGYDNRHLLRCLRQAKGLCKGVVALDPATPKAILHEMAHAGVVGARMNLFGQDLPGFQNETWRRFLSEARQLDWHIEVHCPVTQLPDVLPPLLAFDCKIVIDHFGRPDYESGIDLSTLDYLCGLAQTQRVWVKLSAAYRVWSEKTIAQSSLVAHRLLQAFSARRLVWGSDWPHTEHEASAGFDRALQHLADWIPQEEDRFAILVDTPRLLFQF